MAEQRQPTSFRLGEPEVAILEPRICASVDRSDAIRRILHRYAEVCRRELPALSVPEWKLCMDALNGTILWDRVESISWLVHEVEDALRINKLGEKHGVDGPALLAKLADTTYAQRLAIADTAERFWAAVSRGEQDAKVPDED